MAARIAKYEELMEKKANVNCTVVFGNKDFKKIYAEYIKAKIKEQNK